MAKSKAYDINIDQWSKYSGFKALRTDRPEIRLLRLEKGANAKGLRYVVRHAELRGSPRYTAVSYSWGAPVPVSALREIFIHGESVPVRPILFSFLKVMASHDPGMDFWIDALCINQGDVKERNYQISMMGEIYKTAQETRFERRIFSTSAEKLLKASYWTRRWVIQEFALARELTIVCGAHQTKWDNLTKKINDDILGSDVSARRTLERFKALRLLGSEEPKSLLELMEQFQEARCVDRRDTAFALRAIAKDGVNLSPRYDESVGDVYFRVLSMLPTERVVPEMLGYRWPHQAASRLQNLMQITRQDVLNSLEGSTNDRLYAVFEYTAVIGTVKESIRKRQGWLRTNKFSSYPLEVRLQGSSTRVFHGSGRLAFGDLVYSLQTTPQSPRGLYIAFRPNGPDITVVGMLINEPDTQTVAYWASVGLCETNMELIRNIIVCGMLKCIRNISVISLQRRVLCHITRLVFLLLWLLDARQVDWLWKIRNELPDDSVRISSLCDCPKGNRAPQRHVFDDQATQSDVLEILPSFHFHQNPRFWVGENTLPWADTSQPSPQRIIHINTSQRHSEGSVDFSNHKRTGLSYAAEDGYILFTKYFLSKNDVQINSQDDSSKSPLWWASFNGHEDVVQKLLQKGADVNAGGREYGSALQAACQGGNKKVVQMLLENGADVNTESEIYGSALQAASLGGYKEVVQMLLEKGADVNVEGGQYGSALQAASLGGCKEVVQALLENGASVDTGGGQYGSALQAASQGGNEKVVQILLENGANVNTKGGQRESALQAASKGGHEKVVQMLLENGAKTSG